MDRDGHRRAALLYRGGHRPERQPQLDEELRRTARARRLRPVDARPVRRYCTEQYERRSSAARHRIGARPDHQRIHGPGTQHRISPARSPARPADCPAAAAQPHCGATARSPRRGPGTPGCPDDRRPGRGRSASSWPPAQNRGWSTASACHRGQPEPCGRLDQPRRARRVLPAGPRRHRPEHSARRPASQQPRAADAVGTPGRDVLEISGQDYDLRRAQRAELERNGARLHQGRRNSAARHGPTARLPPPAGPPRTAARQAEEAEAASGAPLAERLPRAAAEDPTRRPN